MVDMNYPNNILQCIRASCFTEFFLLLKRVVEEDLSDLSLSFFFCKES